MDTWLTLSIIDNSISKDRIIYNEIEEWVPL